MEMKFCKRCETYKRHDEYYRCGTGKLQYYCKVCSREYKAKWNKTPVARASDNRYRQTPEGIASYKKANTKYYENPLNRAARNKRQAKYRLTDEYQASVDKYEKSEKRRVTRTKNRAKLEVKLVRNLRDRLNKAIKNMAKSGSAVRDLGCTIDELKAYLESKFQPGMSWKNWGRYGWHIDHIKPMSLLTKDPSNRTLFLEINHYTNLQPLWAKDNLTKGDRFVDIVPDSATIKT